MWSSQLSTPDLESRRLHGQRTESDALGKNRGRYFLTNAIPSANLTANSRAHYVWRCSSHTDLTASLTLCMEPMKMLRTSLLVSIATIALSLAAYPQTPTTIYYDKDWKQVPSSIGAEFYRIVTFDSSGRPMGLTTDYYITGEKQWECRLLSMDFYDANKNRPDGTCTWYFKNGVISQKSTFLNGVQEGLEEVFFNTGKIKNSVTYSKGVPDGEAYFYFESGKVNRKFKVSNGVLRPWFFECDEYGTCETVFRDLFKDEAQTSRNWLLNGASVTKDETLFVRIPADGSRAQLAPAPIGPLAEFSVTVSVQQTYGSKEHSHGIIFGFKDWQNYHYYYLSTKGMYTIGFVANGMNTNLTNWTSSKDIKTGTGQNTIRVHRRYNQFLYSLNGNVLGRFDATPLVGNSFGLLSVAGRTESTVKFSDFEIRQPSEKILPPPPPKAPTPTIPIKKDPVPAPAPLPAPTPAPVKAPEPEKTVSAGTGFFMDPRGYIVTSQHITGNTGIFEVTVTRNGKSESYVAKILIADKQNDIAILKIDDPKFKIAGPLPYALKLGVPDVGAEIFTLGYPDAAKPGSVLATAEGKITSRTGPNDEINSYLLALSVQPGSSGAPLFDSEGNVIAIVNARAASTNNVSYAVKTAYLVGLIQTASEKIVPSINNTMKALPKTEKIKRLSEYVVIVRKK